MLTTCDSYLGALVQGRFDKLSYFGLADREFYFPHNVVDSVRKLKAVKGMWQVHGWKCRRGRRSSSNVAVWQQQKFYGHPILFIPAKGSVTCADIPTYLYTCPFPSSHKWLLKWIEIWLWARFHWLNRHEKFSPLIDYCLDGNVSGYNIIPVENLNFALQIFIMFIRSSSSIEHFIVKSCGIIVCD